MNCSHYRKRIYLFDELNADETQDVLEHITSCPACRRCYQDAQQERALLKAAFTAPEIEHALLTTRIMKAIGNHRRTRVPVVDQRLHFLHHSPLRYALGTLSCLMIVFFLAEFFHAPGPHTEVIMRPDAALPKTVALNGSFYKELKQVRNKDRNTSGANTLSLYTCIQVCRAPAGPECADCKIKYAKLKHHEDI